MRLVALIAVLALPGLASALAVSHSGYVLGASDAPLEGAHTFVFRITDAGGAPVWTSNACNLTVSHGYYATTLGGECTGATALTSDLVPAGTTRLLELTLDSVPLTPPVTLGATPVAGDSSRLAGYDVAGLQGLFDTRYAPIATTVRLDPPSAQAGAINVTGTVTAASFSGGGAALTGLSAANVTAGTLPVARGGTGATSLTSNALLLGAGTGAIGTLGSLGTTGQVLTSTGGSTAPTWTTLSASSLTTGTLGVAQGGTGAGSFTTNALLLGGGTGSLLPLSSFGAPGQVLTSAGSGNAPIWTTPVTGTSSAIFDANMVRSDGGSGTGSNHTMLSMTVDLSGKQDRWIHIYGGTAIAETSNTSNTSILRVVIHNGTATTVSATRQGIGAHSNIDWNGNTTSAMSVQGYFKVTAAYAVPGVTIRLTGGIDGSGFTWGDQVSYTNFDGEQAGGYLGYAIF